MTRHLALTGLFAAVALSITLSDDAAVVHAMTSRKDTIPERAVLALEQGRFLRASLILRDYLTIAPDTAPRTVLVTAEAEAGWGDWEMVERLLRGKPWLDSIASGRGWYLLGRSQLELGYWEESGSSLARYLERAEDLGDREKGLAELRRAAALRESSKYNLALEAYDRARVLLPQVEDWILVYSAGAAASAGDTAQVTQRLARVGAELARDWGWRLRVRGYVNAKNLPGALVLAEAAAADAAMSANRRAEAWARAGEIRLLRADSAGAREALRRSMAIAPGGSGVEGARLLSTMSGLTAKDRLQIGRVYLRHGNADRGIDGLQAYMKASGVTAADRAAVRAELGRALFNAGRYREAEPVLLEAAQKATSPSSAADALHLAGRAQYRAGKQTAARNTFLRVAERYPNTDAAARSMYISADLDHDEGNLTRARERYRRTATMSSDIDEVGLAYMRLGGLAMSAGNYEQAIKEFDAYRKVYPRGRRFQQATYWSALALSRLGQPQAAEARLREARAFDPFSYYGGRAAQQLGGPSLSIELAPGPERLAAHEEKVTRALSRVDLLKEIGWDDAATYDLDRAKALFARSDGAIYSFAEALAARGFTSMSISLGWDVYRREGAWNARLLRIIYPFPFQNLIIPEARERGVDPFLAAALIRQESMFNTNAISGAGAIGLMQVMPTTGRTLAKSLAIRKFSPQLLKQAEVNIHLGMAHLADALRTYGGRLPVVLASYNAGDGRIDRWREFPEFDDDELFTERIPFTETRDYVKIVQNNARLYAALYSELAEQ